MTQLKYLIPETLDEALELLEKGVPLAGGSALTPTRRDLKAVIDLRKLGLDKFRVDGDNIVIGAAMKLQAIVDAQAPLPAAFREACKLETGWNLRNMATLGGTIISSDGRSRLLTTLLALNAQISEASGQRILPLHELLRTRDEVNLITAIQFSIPTNLVYEQVARAPADLALVCAAVGFFQDNGADKITIGLGGFGEYPIRLIEAEKTLAETQDPELAVRAAQDAYKTAEDIRASAEYRSEIAGVLVRRLLKEVRG